MVAPAMVLPTDSVLIATGSGPADVTICAVCRFLAWANDHSLYVIAPSVVLIAPAVPSLPLAPSPTPPLNVFPAPLPQAPSDALSRYCWKLSVVPDSSLRNTTWMGVAGSVASGLRAPIAGSSQLVMAPLKIFAVVGPSRIRLSTPATLYEMAIGPNTTGRFHAGDSQRCCACAYSSALSGTSEPAKSVWPPTNSRMPAPDPLGV